MQRVRQSEREKERKGEGLKWWWWRCRLCSKGEREVKALEGEGGERSNRGSGTEALARFSTAFWC
jgi:hypothetical protein